MIRITKKIGSAIPDVLISKGIPATNRYKETYESTGNTDFEFDSDIYAHKDVKARLIALQDGKCCFCESKITHISYGDVEHYRPKAGWVQDDEPINKPGYYWLAYDWDNLLLSCQICNQRHKKNYFPLLDVTKRALNHSCDVHNEEPFFIHPVNDNPEEHIEFDGYTPRRKNNSIRGQVTISKLGLDRSELNEQRKSKLELIETVYNLAKGTPETGEKENAKRLIYKLQLDDAEYASMLRCLFKKNPIDF